MVLVAEVALAGEVVITVIIGIVVVAVGERKKVVVAVVTGVAAILRLRLLRYWGCVVLLYLRNFLFLCAVAVNIDFGEARRCDGG